MIVFGYSAIVTGVTFIDRSERRIPVQYAKRVVGRKMYGGQSTFIPLKANADGVMPLIFAMTIMQVPAMIGQFWPDGGFYKSMSTDMSASSEHWYGHLVYYVIYSLLIMVLLLTSIRTISFNPVEISEEPAAERRLYTGHPSRQAHRRISEEDKQPPDPVRRDLPYDTGHSPHGAAWCIRTQLHLWPHERILIMVSVALETSAQLESMMLMRHYKGFLG